MIIIKQDKQVKTETRGRKPYKLHASYKIDWSRPNIEIKQKLGVSLMTVRKLRDFLKQKHLPVGRPKNIIKGCP